MNATFAAPDDAAIPVTLVAEDSFDVWRAAQDRRVGGWADAAEFTGKLGRVLVIRGDDGSAERVFAGYGTPASRARGRHHLAQVASVLPGGTYRLVSDLTGAALDQAALGWLFSAYAFDRYKDKSGAKARLVAPEGVDAARLEALATAEFLTRDLVNTPTSDMGPDALEQAFRKLAETHGADCRTIAGDDLLVENLPMIHTVGRASAEAPRLLDMRWGDAGPRLTLVGKGVCFDTGGLNLKPGASMALMKKDMGGAANVMGLASMIMSQDLPVRLRVLISAVENSVSANAFRPGDVLTARSGKTVEINNTDAEGRLVLADALCLADEEEADLIISMATLTGAARVAVGPDLAPFYSTDTALSGHLRRAADKLADPVWEMPFWDPYETMIEPDIADLDNAPKGGFAGSITAALFLRRFVETCPRYLHFDIFSWCPAARPGMTQGGLGQGSRAVFGALPDMLGL